jgi:acetolactate synthase I/II/III large subunit
MTTQTEGKQTAGQLLVRSLVNQEVKFIFGIPGGKIMPTFDVLNDEGPKIIVCRHEQNAAFMAALATIPSSMGQMRGMPGSVRASFTLMTIRVRSTTIISQRSNCMAALGTH